VGGGCDDDVGVVWAWGLVLICAGGGVRRWFVGVGELRGGCGCVAR
jgi:hypothetical protein